MAPDRCGSLRGCNYFLALEPGANKNVGRRISAGAGYSDKGSAHVLSGVDGDFCLTKATFPPFFHKHENNPSSHPLFDGNES